MMAEVITTDGSYTIGGVALGILFLVLKDFIRDRMSRPLERGKLDNLTEQTGYLREICEAQRAQRRFGKKQAKRIRLKLDGIHQDVVIVKKQTEKEKGT